VGFSMWLLWLCGEEKLGVVIGNRYTVIGNQ